MDLDEISAQYVPKREREQGEDEDEEKRNGDEDQQHSHMNSIDLLHHLYSRGPPELARYPKRTHQRLEISQISHTIYGVCGRQCGLTGGYVLLGSPHTVEGWSLKKYSQFLDAQEKEVIARCYCCFWLVLMG